MFKKGGADENLGYRRGNSCTPTKTECEQLRCVIECVSGWINRDQRLWKHSKQASSPTKATLYAASVIALLTGVEEVSRLALKMASSPL